jgi:hypothetical protein
MPTLKITESTDNFISTRIEISDEELVNLCSLSPEETCEWVSRYEREHEVEWVQEPCGNESELAFVDRIDPITGLPEDAIYER